MSAVGSLAPEAFSADAGQTRTPLDYLLHALNQPLTGLQCALELSDARPRSSEEYGRTIREALELTCRMRSLVEALREIVEMQSGASESPAGLLLNELVLRPVEELRPVAETKAICFQFLGRGSLPICGDGHYLERVIFRLLDSVISLAAAGSELQICASGEDGHACISIAWKQDKPPEGSPFSRPELGLLISRAAWEHIGGHWTQGQAGDRHSCTLKTPLNSEISCGNLSL